MSKKEIRRILIGTYRPECLDWIQHTRLYNLPIVKGIDGASLPKFTHCVLFAKGHEPIAYAIRFSHVQGVDWLRIHKYQVSQKPHSDKYAIYELSKTTVDADSLLKDKKAIAVVSSARLPTCKIDDEFFTRPFPKTGGNSMPYIFEQLRPYFQRLSALYIYNPTQLDFMKELGIEKREDVLFPAPKNPKFRFIDLFAGIGGIRLGFQGAGNECVFSSEWDAAAQKTYKRNFGGDVAGDITKISPADIPQFDILCGGFPCQPFSSIGKRQGFSHPTQGTLFFYIKEILRVRRPKAFFLENVPGLLTHDNKNTIKVIEDTFAELKYDVWYGVLDAADYGVPQRRKRLYFVGYDKNLGLKFIPPRGRFVGKPVGIGKFIESNAQGYEITKHLQDAYIFKKNDGHPEIVDSTSDFPVKTLCASYHKIQRITGTFVRDGKTGLRLLTKEECKAIQGFPKKFEVPVSRTSMHHQFGNSVAVPVIRAIADTMTKQLLTVKG